MKELEQLKFLNLKIQEATSKSVAITEKLVTTNKTAPPPPPVKYPNVLHHNRT